MHGASLLVTLMTPARQSQWSTLCSTFQRGHTNQQGCSGEIAVSLQLVRASTMMLQLDLADIREFGHCRSFS
ncbi:unnamed protein product [Caenorhabditis brenneri]